MRIGIDIDDTITDSWNFLIPFFSERYDIPAETLKTSFPYFRAVENLMTKEEYFQNIRDLCNNEIINAPLREGAYEYINKLYDEGNEIIFITARGIEYDNAYRLTKDYLRKMHIPYSKIIVSAYNKSIPCLEEKIDLFIDDSIVHCKEVAETGIKTLLYETPYNKIDETLNHIKSWKKVYEYINEVNNEK